MDTTRIINQGLNVAGVVVRQATWVGRRIAGEAWGLTRKLRGGDSSPEGAQETTPTPTPTPTTAQSPPRRRRTTQAAGGRTRRTPKEPTPAELAEQGKGRQPAPLGSTDSEAS
jgi:hypothetical protein